jgi:hypothetical protein
MLERDVMIYYYEGYKMRDDEGSWKCTTEGGAQQKCTQTLVTESEGRHH